MPNKYQHALMDMKRSRAWQSIADELTVGLGETVNRSDVWGTAKGKWSSQKVMTAMENLGLVKVPGPRYRLAVDFPDDETRTAFKEFYEIDNDELTFTEWVLSTWERDTMRNKCTMGGTNSGDIDINTNGGDDL